MRSSLASVAALATLAVVVPAGPTAYAASSDDWRAAACAEDNRGGLARRSRCWASWSSAA